MNTGLDILWQDDVIGGVNTGFFAVRNSSQTRGFFKTILGNLDSKDFSQEQVLANYLLQNIQSYPSIAVKWAFMPSEYWTYGHVAASIDPRTGGCRGGWTPDSLDFNIPKNEPKWNKIEIFLYKELNKNLLKYIKQINSKNYTSKYNNDYDSSIFNNDALIINYFMVQKYEKNKGKYVYHNDFHINNNKNYRVITFLWYLNTIDEGGETEFWDSYKIKPTTGKLILFPSTWSYPHRGIMPISDDKYIITGWFYIEY
jgi:hypothetical protein